MVNGATHGYEYDIIVIGGGSGGLAASKEAARYRTSKLKNIYC
jgi:pyruvate/2-oxoglutarate dehydrogenase complex dihydrolipoamide dehydrogenase (E3) component